MLSLGAAFPSAFGLWKLVWATPEDSVRICPTSENLGWDIGLAHLHLAPSKNRFVGTLVPRRCQDL